MTAANSRLPVVPGLPPHGPASHRESLALALSGLLARRGVAVSYDELLAELGLTTLTLAVPDESDIRRWAVHGQDVFLIPAAADLGLRLRELHPPEAARGLESAREFADHFRDSYAPLIRRALAGGQAVLAWRGWAGQDAHEWGEITQARGDGFEGFVAGDPARQRRLVGPAHQVYVVESYDAVDPSSRGPAAVWARTAQRAARLWDNEIGSDLPYATGSAAYDLWLERLGRLTPATGAAQRAIAGQRTVARRIAAARAALARWLTSHDAALPPHDRPRARAVAEQCTRVRREAELLAALDPQRATTDAAAIEARVLGAVRRLRAADEQLVACIRTRGEASP